MKGVIVQAGAIDRDYTGEIQVIIQNVTNQEQEIKKGTAIAQIIFKKIENQAVPTEVDKLPETKRAEKGFGSTEEKSKPLTKEEKWYTKLEDGYAPCGKCPHGIRMYCSEHLNDCIACNAELLK